MMEMMQLAGGVAAAGLGLANGGALLAGVASAALYAWKRQILNAALALLAGVALAAMLSSPTLPAAGAGEIAIATERAPGDTLARALLAVPQAGSISLTGHGLRAAQWDDLPARPLRWSTPQGSLLRLDFPRTLPLGRPFVLTARHTAAQPGWRLQLLAENGQLLAESAKTAVAGQPRIASAIAATGAASLSGTGSAATPPAAAPSLPTPALALALSWQPPLAETLLLQARILDAAGKVVAQGPLPLLVTAPLPLQIIGRFGAPSFDARALNQLLTDSSAILDWQTTLGKGLSRSEAARAALAEPNVQVIDAAYFETLAAPARAALLARTGQGVPLMILAGNAADAGIWQRELGLRLLPQSATTEKEDIRRFAIGGELLSLPPATLEPAVHMAIQAGGQRAAQPASQLPAQPSGRAADTAQGPPPAQRADQLPAPFGAQRQDRPAAAADDAGSPATGWVAAAADDQGRPWLWQRRWQKGSIAWIGVSDWHRYAIVAPAALGHWWQALLDRTGGGATQAIRWQQPDPMPVAGLRTEVCAEGIAAGTALHMDGLPPAAWQARSARADVVCAAFWPRQAGWLALRSGTAQHSIYIHAKDDWPLWQQALRHDATVQYAARSQEPPASAASQRAPLPAWPFALLCASAMLALWWRERR